MSSSFPFTLQIPHPPPQVIHLVNYQRYYDALMQRYREGIALQIGAPRPPVPQAPEDGDAWAFNLEGDAGGGDGGEVDVDTWTERVVASLGRRLARSMPGLPRKPRMLICAPSNIAVDVLLDRVIESGFYDGRGDIYRPALVRVGSESAQLTERVRGVEVRFLVDAMLRWDAAKCDAELAAGRRAASELDARVHRAHEAILASSMGKDGAAMADPGYGAWLERQHRDLMDACEQQDRVLVELARVVALREQCITRGGPGAREKLRGLLEASLVNEAELVFATLSTAGQNVFRSLSHGFQTVIVDEAAQATEVQLLPALLRGCRHCVLVGKGGGGGGGNKQPHVAQPTSRPNPLVRVPESASSPPSRACEPSGDPQQLPATVISQASARLQYQRSLFERLSMREVGWPVQLLSVQVGPSLGRSPSLMRAAARNLL